MSKNNFRIESDSMGKMKVPKKSLYAAQTARAIQNFPISDLKFKRPFIEALGVIKFCSAKVNGELNLLPKSISKSIMKASQEVIDGKHDGEFVVDIFQTGSGTSSNMNANEVIASLANKFHNGKEKIHPNDHVNLCQSSNDVIPTAMHISAYKLTKNELIPSLKILKKEFNIKEKKFKNIYKIGRTHLQDATPMTLGQEFGGFSQMIDNSLEYINLSLSSIKFLSQGGTAVGTGINSHPKFAKKISQQISNKVGYKFYEAKNHFESQSSKDAIVNLSGSLKTCSTSLSEPGMGCQL